MSGPSCLLRLAVEYPLLRLDCITLDRTLGFVGAVMALERLLKAELRTDMVMPPPRDSTALA